MMLAVQMTLQHESRSRFQANRNLSPTRNNSAPFPRTMALRGNACSDGAIDPCGCQNGKSGTRRQKTQPRFTAFIIAFSKLKRPIYRLARASLKRAIGFHQSIGRDLADPRCGQVSSSKPSIRANIARDVGKLHGNAQINGERICFRVVNIQNRAHHQPDSTCNGIGIIQKGSFISQCHWLQVRAYSCNQCL